MSVCQSVHGKCPLNLFKPVHFQTSLTPATWTCSNFSTLEPPLPPTPALPFPSPVLTCSFVAYLSICRQAASFRLKKTFLLQLKMSAFAETVSKQKHEFHKEIKTYLYLLYPCCCIGALSRKCDQTVDYMGCYSFHRPPICEINKYHYHNKSSHSLFTFKLCTSTANECPNAQRRPLQAYLNSSRIIRNCLIFTFWCQPCRRVITLAWYF